MSSNIDKILQDLAEALKANTNGSIKTAGITDSATREQLIITDAGVQTGILSVERVSGNLTVSGDVLTNRVVASGKSEFSNLKVTGKLEADSLQVKKILTDQSIETYSKSITFAADSPKELDGKGLLWNEGDLTRQFIYRAEPRRLFSTESIDLMSSSSYYINGVSVVEETRLGNSIRDSRLKTVGTLEKLNVSGDVTLSDTVFVNGAFGRLGINTEQPNAAISVVDNNTEVVLGANEDGTGFVGTYSVNAFSIVTDNTQRITLKGATTEFGNANSKNAVVKIYGTLEVDSIVSDSRVERTHPIEFRASKDNSIFGKGLMWVGEGNNRQLFMMPNPDRLYSSEAIDLAVNKTYCINRKTVLSADGLGETVVNSSLKTLGELTGLTVTGDVDFPSLKIKENRVEFSNSISINSGHGNLRLSSAGIEADNFQIVRQDNTDLEITDDRIQIGNQNQTDRVINAYGKLAVNITNPLPEASFSVDGLVIINGKKFINSNQEPLSGTWSKGDIVWNTNPQETSYIGWVCTMTGTPGTWKPFGYIGAK
jgi:hypothetical protein